MKKHEVKKTLLQAVPIIFILVLVLSNAVIASSGGGSGHGEGGVHNAWLKNDWFKLMNFAVLVIAGFFIAKKPVAEFFSSRAKGIEQEIQELEQKKAQAEQELAEYQAKFKNLDQESKLIVEDYIKQGEDAKKRILAEAQAQADKLEDMAKRNIEQEFKAAKAKLQQEVVEAAMEKAEDLIKASISSEDQEKLVDDYLKKVVA